MDEKGARICILAREEIIVLIGIKEIYMGIPENRISLTVIEYISADEKAILPVIIIPDMIIIVSWFHIRIIGYKVIIISLTGYTNEGIYLL
jgi:hypothetical protein